MRVLILCNQAFMSAIDLHCAQPFQLLDKHFISSIFDKKGNLYHFSLTSEGLTEVGCCARPFMYIYIYYIHNMIYIYIYIFVYTYNTIYMHNLCSVRNNEYIYEHIVKIKHIYKFVQNAIYI